MELGYFLGGLAECGRSGEGLRHALALAEQAQLRMARTIRAGTMAARPSAAAWDGGHGTGPEIAPGEELPQQLVSSGFQFGQRVGHKAPPVLSIYILRTRTILAYIVKPPFPCRAPEEQAFID